MISDSATDLHFYTSFERLVLVNYKIFIITVKINNMITLKIRSITSALQHVFRKIKMVMNVLCNLENNTGSYFDYCFL